MKKIVLLILPLLIGCSSQKSLEYPETGFLIAGSGITLAAVPVSSMASESDDAKIATGVMVSTAMVLYSTGLIIHLTKENEQ